jgi:hypothetical protein
MVLVVALLAVVVVQEEKLAQTQPVMDAAVLLVAVVAVTYQTILAVEGQFVLSGPVRLAHSRPQTQVICNGTLYSHQRWATF